MTLPPTTRSLFLAAFAILGSLLGRAGEPPPTEITSTSLEMWSTDTETFAICTGQVVVTGNDLKLTCDRLDLTTSRFGDKTATLGKLDKFKYMLAKGNVRILQGDREATCGRAEVFPREDKIILTEDPMIIDHGNSWTGAGEVITLFRGQRRALIDKPRFILPPIKDLGFDKNESAPAGDAPTSGGEQPAEKPKADNPPAPPPLSSSK